MPMERRNAPAYMLAFDNTSGTATGIALNNVSSAAAAVVLVSGDVTAGKQQLGQPGRWILIPADEPHRLSRQNEAEIVGIEVR